jgi:hypothetical protein
VGGFWPPWFGNSDDPVITPRITACVSRVLLDVTIAGLSAPLSSTALVKIE